MLENYLFVALNQSDFARKLASFTQCSVAYVKVDHFADTEAYLSSLPDNLYNTKIILTHRFAFHAGQSINAQLWVLSLVIATLRSRGAQEIVGLFPYLPYSRQDGKGNSSAFMAMVCKFLHDAGLDKIVCIDLHNPAIVEQLSLPIITIAMDEFWANTLRSYNDPHALVLASPDAGSCVRVERIARRLDVPYVCAKKERTAPDTTRTLGLQFYSDTAVVKDRTIVLCDDIIDTGGTALGAAKLLRKYGARDVIGCFTHGICSANAGVRLSDGSFSLVMTTDSIHGIPTDGSAVWSVQSSAAYIAQKLAFIL